MSNTTQSLPVRIRTLMLKSQTECGEWFIDVKMIHAAPFTFTHGQSPRCVEGKTSLEKKEIITFHLQPPLKCCNFFFFLTSQSPKEVCDGSVKSYFHCIVYRLSWRVFKSFFFCFFLEVYSMFPEWEVLFRNVRGPARWPDSQCCHQSNFKCTVLYFQPIFYFYFYFFF